MRTSSLFVLALLTACSGDGDSGKVPDTDAGVDTDDTDIVDTDDTDVVDTDDTDVDPPGPVTLTNPTWTLHPDIGSMVYVQWDQDQDEDVHIEYSFDAGEWMSSPTALATAGSNERLLVGIPFGMDAEWRIVAETGQLDGTTITTGPTPPGLPVGVVEVADPANWYAPGNYMLTSINADGGGWTGGNYWTFIIDRQARPVWAMPTPQQHWTLFTQVAVTGDRLLIDEAVYWSTFPHNGDGSVIHERYLDSEIQVIPTPGLHHAFVQLPDGTLAWGSQSHGGGEALVEKAPGQPDETVLWTCDDDWPGAGRGPESNGLYYSPLRDTYLYSFYTNNSMVEVDRASGTSLWWAGDVSGGYDFVPDWSQYSWQHGVSWTDAGTLLVSTEGCLDSSVGFFGCSGSGNIHTWAREYVVDDIAGTLTNIWSADSGVRADTNGDTWRLSNGNTLHTVGAAGQIMEYDPAGTPLWHVDMEQNGLRDPLLGRGQFIEDLYTLVAP